jgi:hypothetical protein
MDACITHARFTKFALLAIPKTVCDVFAKDMFCYCRSFHFFSFSLFMCNINALVRSVIAPDKVSYESQIVSVQCSEHVVIC